MPKLKKETKLPQLYDVTDIGVIPRYEEAETEPPIKLPVPPRPPLKSEIFQGGRPGGGAGGSFATEKELTPEEARKLPHMEYMRYLAKKYGGPEAGIFGPDDTGRQDVFKGGQTVVSPATGGEITFPGGVSMEQMYAVSPSFVAEKFPAFIDESGDLDMAAVERARNPKRIGPPVPADFVKPNYEDRDGFSQAVIHNVLGGVDPTTFNPYTQVENAMSNLPEMFNRVFQNEYQWSDRGSLPENEARHWQTTVSQYRARLLSQYNQHHKNLYAKYNRAMEMFDARANRAKEAREALGKQKAAETKGISELRSDQKKAWESARDNLRADFSAMKDITGLTADSKNRFKAEQRQFEWFAENHTFDIDPAAALQRSKEKVQAAINAYWVAFNKANTKEKSILNTKIKAALGYVPTERPLIAE
ncbi:MAG: hypothetical protein ACW99J_16135 [Candidatus Thorarchaeota archaeon]|jgi:hypothetical protein